jgi:hypothetical protein
MSNILHFKYSTRPSRNVERFYTTTKSTHKHGYWKDKHNQKKFFDQLAIKLNIKTKDDWNNVTEEMVLKEGGYFFRRYYDSLQRGRVFESDI